jgi:hypothetical protein
MCSSWSTPSSAAAVQEVAWALDPGGQENRIETGVELDEVDPGSGLTIDLGADLPRRRHLDDQPVEAVAVQDRAGDEDGGPRQHSGFGRRPDAQQGRRIAPGIPHRRHAVRQEGAEGQGSEVWLRRDPGHWKAVFEGEAHGPDRQVGVGLDQARDQESPASVDPAGRLRNDELGGPSDGGDAPVRDEHDGPLEGG